MTLPSLERDRKAKAVESESFTCRMVFEPDEEAGGYTVSCPALPGLVSEGDMLEGARQRTAGAIRCYLESLRKDGLPVPRAEDHDNDPSGEVVLEDAPVAAPRQP